MWTEELLRILENISYVK